MKPTLVFLIGPPGCGKGTAARTFAQLNPKFNHWEMSAILRSYKEQYPIVAEEIERSCSQGKLVSDNVVFSALTDKLVSMSGDLLLDGFPRTIGQAMSLVKLSAHYEVRGILCQLDAETCSKRIAEGNRGRSDDVSKIVHDRLLDWFSIEANLYAYLEGYLPEGNVYRQDMSLSRDEIVEQIGRFLVPSLAVQA